MTESWPHPSCTSPLSLPSPYMSHHGRLTPSHRPATLASTPHGFTRRHARKRFFSSAWRPCRMCTMETFGDAGTFPAERRQLRLGAGSSGIPSSWSGFFFSPATSTSHQPHQHPPRNSACQRIHSSLSFANWQFRQLRGFDAMTSRSDDFYALLRNVFYHAGNGGSRCMINFPTTKSFH